MKIIRESFHRDFAKAPTEDEVRYDAIDEAEEDIRIALADMDSDDRRGRSDEELKALPIFKIESRENGDVIDDRLTAEEATKELVEFYLEDLADPDIDFKQGFYQITID